MDIKNSLTMIISSCGAFNDLWDNYIFFLRKSWNMDCRIILATDLNEKNKRIPGVGIFKCGCGVEFSERLKMVLKTIKTPFVFLILNGCFLTKPVASRDISKRLDYAIKNNIDYHRPFLRPRPKRKSMLPNDPTQSLYELSYNDDRSFNLYPAILRLASIRMVCDGKAKNFWQFQAALNKGFKVFKPIGVADVSSVIRAINMAGKKKSKKFIRVMGKNELSAGDAKRWIFKCKLKFNIPIFLHEMDSVKAWGFSEKNFCFANCSLYSYCKGQKIV